MEGLNVKKIIKKISGIMVVLVALIIWCIYSYQQGGESILTSSRSFESELKFGWGIKRVPDHKQPELRKN